MGGKAPERQPAKPDERREQEVGADRKGRPPDADTTLRRKIKRLWTHAEAAQAASAQARQAIGPGQGAGREAEDEDTALRRIVQGLHESSARTAKNRALRELRSDRRGPGTDTEPRPDQDENRQGADTDVRSGAQGQREASARTVEARALRGPRPDNSNRGKAPDAPDDETTLGRIMKKLRTRTAAAQAASAQAKQAVGRQPAQAPRATQAHAKAMQTMQVAQAQVQQAMQALRADGAAQDGGRGRGDKKDKKGKGLFARAFAALRGAGQKPPPPSAEDSQMVQRVNARALRTRRDARAAGLDEEMEALGGGAILTHIGFDPSSIEYVQTSVGDGVVMMDLHSGPDWRIYHFMLGAAPFWLLCPKGPPGGPASLGRDPRAREVFLVKKLKRTLEARGM